MSKASAVWMFTLLAVASSTGYASRRDDPDGDHPLALRIAAIEEYLHSQVKAGFSGTVLIASQGRVVLQGVYAPPGSDLTVNTEFWLGSVSKNVAAAAILKLQEQGRLKTSDSIGEYLSGIPEEKRAMTIHQLLTHTSGLGENYAADGIADAEEAVRAIMRRPLLHPPGDAYLYTNDGYNLLAIIVAIASGLPYEEYVRSQLLEPVGMTHTGFWGVASTSPRNVVAPSLRQADSRIAAANWGYRGATGLRSTVGDLYRWSNALDRALVLSSASVGELFKPHATVSETRAYGYGWQLVKTSRGTNAQVHTGADDGIGGFAALYRFVDEGVLVILLSNASESVAVETLKGLFGKMF